MVSERRKAQLKKAQETYRKKKRIERQFQIIEEKQAEKEVQSLPEVVEPLPEGNYHCSENSDCLKIGYKCTLGLDYAKCLYYIKLHPQPITPSHFKEQDEQESNFYNGLRKRKDKYSVGIN